ncbi:MAG: hypothetical protein ACOY4U_11165 [Pseudomonadota bacterium]
MHKVRAILAVILGAFVGYVLLAFSERDTSVLSLSLRALAYVLPGVIAGLIATRHAAISGLLAGLLPYISYVAPYAAVYHYSPDEVATALLKGLALYGAPCALCAGSIAYFRGGTRPSS